MVTIMGGPERSAVALSIVPRLAVFDYNHDDNAALPALFAMLMVANG